MSRRRILFVLDSLEVGGTERSTLQIAARLQRFRPLVVHAFPGESLAREFADAGVPTRALDLPDGTAWRTGVSRLRDVMREFAPDLVHSALFRSDMLARAVAPAAGIPLVNGLVNDSYGPARAAITRGRRRLSLAGVRFVDRVSAPLVDRFFANSHAIARSHVCTLGLSPSRIVVIPRGRDVGPFSPDARNALRVQTRASLGLRDDELLVLNVARLIERKGHRELVDALSLLQTLLPRMRLCIAGDGPERGALQARIEQLGLAGRVQLLGTRSDVEALLAAADVFALPSHYEGFPGALVEAMMAGVPLVPSDIEMNREALGPFADDTRWSGVNDAASIAAALAHVCADLAAARGRAEAIASFARNAYSIDAVARAHEDEYARLLDESSARGRR